MADYPKVNIKLNLANMSGDSKFVDFKEKDTVWFRLAPPLPGTNGLMWYEAINHYKLKDQDGRGIALADLSVHGNDETGRQDYIADLSAALMGGENEELKKIGKAIKANSRYYAQGWEATRIDEKTFRYSKCKFLALPKTGAQEVLRVFQAQQEMGEAEAYDPERGQLLYIKKTGSGFGTRYPIERTGIQTPLAEIVPDWEDQMFKDVYEALKLNVYDRDTQKRIAQLTYPGLPWAELEEKYGL